MLACRVRVIVNRFLPVLSHVLSAATYGDTARDRTPREIGSSEACHMRDRG